MSRTFVVDTVDKIRDTPPSRILAAFTPAPTVLSVSRHPESTPGAAYQGPRDLAASPLLAAPLLLFPGLPRHPESRSSSASAVPPPHQSSPAHPSTAAASLLAPPNTAHNPAPKCRRRFRLPDRCLPASTSARAKSPLPLFRSAPALLEFAPACTGYGPARAHIAIAAAAGSRSCREIEN